VVDAATVEAAALEGPAEAPALDGPADPPTTSDPAIGQRDMGASG
jgi:hypothetical protein